MVRAGSRPADGRTFRRSGGRRGFHFCNKGSASLPQKSKSFLESGGPARAAPALLDYDNAGKRCAASGLGDARCFTLLSLTCYSQWRYKEKSKLRRQECTRLSASQRAKEIPH